VKQALLRPGTLTILSRPPINLGKYDRNGSGTDFTNVYSQKMGAMFPPHGVQLDVEDHSDSMPIRHRRGSTYFLLELVNFFDRHYLLAYWIMKD
jgi:hypothetical protein